MHGAPSVSYPVGRSFWGAAIGAAAWALGAAAAIAWSLQPGGAGWRQALAGGAVVLAGAFALAHWLRSPVGVLRWDGRAWHWQLRAGGDEVEGSIEVACDLQRMLLLRWRSHGWSGWLWAERASIPHGWDELRRAVYSRARPEALHGPEPPQATP